jgi:hypothetical protein
MPVSAMASDQSSQASELLLAEENQSGSITSRPRAITQGSQESTSAWALLWPVAALAFSINRRRVDKAF